MRVEKSFGSQKPTEKNFLQMLRAWFPVLRELLRNFNGLQVSGRFSSTDVIDDILAYQHNLGSNIVEVTLIDETGTLRPDIAMSGAGILIADENTILVDMTGIVMTGAWAIMVRRD